jgi:site-specific DNA recombinase
VRAGLYARVSREEQAEGYSIDEQMEAMRRFCKERGWAVAAEYAELGHTGTVTERPEFSRALHDCEAGRIDILLTHQLDRFYRNLALQLDTLGQLGRWGVGYLSVTEQIDYSTPQGMLFLQMLGAFNEYYVANLSRETKKGKRGRAKAGKSNASTTPYGYRRNDAGQDVVDPETSRAVVLAYESYATERHSDADVARLLREGGYPAGSQAKSGRWTREGVRYLLTNPFYTGQVRHGAELYPGRHEALIPQELFDRVQAIRQRRGRGKGAGRDPNRVYLLARLARCHRCGLKLWAQTSGGKGRRSTPAPYYVCPGRRRSTDCPDGGHYVPAGEIEEQIADLIRRLRLPDDWRQRLEELAEHRDDQDNVEGRRKYLKGKLKRLRALFLEGDIDKAEYDRDKRELQAQLDALQVPEQPALEQAGKTLESLGAEWANAPRRYQHEMLNVIFEAVDVDIAARKLVCVKPHPQFAPLFRMDGLEEKDGYFYPSEA